MIRRNLKIPEIAQFSTARILNFETPSFGILDLEREFKSL